MLKCARLARFLRDDDRRLAFSYEASGYPSTPDGVDNKALELGRIAGRVHVEKGQDGANVERMRTTSVEALEQDSEACRLALAAAADRNVSISSANPHQIVAAPVGNAPERARLKQTIQTNSSILARSRAFAYEYSSSVLYELEFSNTASSAFSRTSERIDSYLITHMRDLVKTTQAINDNLQSENPEAWANAVHGYRRLMQAVADDLYPAREDKTVGTKTIKLGADHYINRLIAFAEERSASKRFSEIVGSSLAYLGNRLDALFKAAQKGSHSEISTKDEAERYVVYTYLTIGDLLTLRGA